MQSSTSSNWFRIYNRGAFSPTPAPLPGYLMLKKSRLVRVNIDHLLGKLVNLQYLVGPIVDQQ